ncbi:DUF6878 family protein [Brevundimonas mediterranea]|uniref:DUF6878 domain-containing protein n=1 Tax=Brevundimonas mediterranea TaxID=74329 RepID=A0A7Z9C6N9_9CAUL|nr:DUF6878 family protein [Brevundimonas mediterranea]VDC50059.1 hypothetical protein BREV_BREV_00135 [Brevundimonas mediterranea]
MTEETHPTPDVKALLQKAFEQDRRDAVRLEENKTAVFDRLAGSRIARIRVEFDGGGDSGQIESIEAETAQGEDADFPAEVVSLRFDDRSDGERRFIDYSLREAVEVLTYDCLGREHSGWENNDGAYGTFVFDVPARTIRLEMNERVTDSLFSEHLF